MALAPTPCRIPQCPQYAKTGGVCEDHKPVWAGSYRRARLPRDWNTRRLIVMKRDNNTCYQCGQTATDVDHLVAGDDHSLGNLAAICSNCHKQKTSNEGHTAKAGNKIKRF